MTISKYHLTRFILDVVYEDQNKSKACSWDEWIRKIKRIYNNRIPDSILNGLIRKNNEELNPICESLLMEYMTKEQILLDRINKKEVKHERWLQKLEENKIKEELRKQEVKNAQREKQKTLDEQFTARLMNEWQEKLTMLQEKRNSEFAIYK